MPKIKTQNITTALPSTATPVIPSQGIASISVPKARAQRAFKGEGSQYIAAGAQSLSQALEGVALVHAKKEEELRMANSKLMAESMNETFLERLDQMKERRGENAQGLLNELKDEYQDLKDTLIPEEVDDKTRRELNLAFEKAYNQHAREVISWQASQSEVAKKNVRQRNMVNSHKRINLLPIGDIDSVEEYAKTSADIEIALNTHYNEKQKADVLSAYKEDYLTHAYIKWFIDSPTVATHSWEDNKEILKKALPTKYSMLATKYEQAKEDSKYDVADGMLKMIYGDDYVAMADELMTNYEKYDLHADQAFQLASRYQAQHNFETSENNRQKQEVEDKFFIRAREKYYNKDTGVFNNHAYLADLEQNYRMGNISKSSFDAARTVTLRGEFSTDDYHELMDDVIHKRVITKGQINARLLGTGGKPEPFYAQLEKVRNDEKKGWPENYFNEAALKYDREARKKRTELDVKKKELMLDPSLRPDFSRDLIQRARELGYSPGDSRIIDEANKMLQSGWYNYGKPEFHPGKAPWLITGEKYLRRWEYDANLEQMKEEGDIEYIPGKTATSGNLEDEETKAAIEFLQGKRKQITPDTIKAAKQWLKQKEVKE